jgi:uncharacterized protein (TIGR02421 family)
VNPAIRSADRTLCEVALGLDYLLAVTPVDVPDAWRRFHAGGYRQDPTFRYRELPPGIEELEGRLSSIDLDTVGDRIVGELLERKRDELRMQIEGLRWRNEEGFLATSLALYGDVDDRLVDLANRILALSGPARRVPPERRGRIVGARTFARRAMSEIQGYRRAYPVLASKVEIRPDVPGVMAFEGDLLVASTLKVPVERVEALIQHEVGTHLVTHANGQSQPFQQLGLGLAGYEETQEALAVFAEYAVGGLTQARLAQLAARVVAVRGLLDGQSFTETFRTLRRRHRMPPRAAFQVVARVFRSGGLTKDAIYLRGLVALLAYLSGGGPLEPLFVGKLPLDCVPLVAPLRELGLAGPPPLRPAWLDQPGAQRRIEAAREGISVLDMTEEAAA